jgi:cytochrome c553
MPKFVIKSCTSFNWHWNHWGLFMNTRVGSLLLALLALLLTPTIGAATPQQAESTNNGLPWAYGFATSAPPGEPARAPARGRGAAAPANPTEDTQTLMHLPAATAAFKLKQIDDNFGPADWFPNDHPPMPETVAHGRKPDVPACGFCHYPNGKGRPNNAGPAGLPAAYILQQLEDFKDGARKSWDTRKRNTNQMITIAKALNDDEMKAAAEYFASMQWTPWIKVVETETVPKTQFLGGGGGLSVPLEGAEAGTEPIGQRLVEVPASPEDTEPLRNPRSGFIAYVPVGTLKKGEALVTKGGDGKTVACAACHGEGLKGNGNFPSLAGRSPSYLARQLYDMQHFTRVGPGTQLMQQVVEKLSEDDILAITAYIASLNP